MSIAHIRTRASLMSLCMVMAATCGADSWSLPEEATYTSGDGRWRLTVTPRELSSQLAYFEDKAAAKDKADERPGGNENANALLQRRAGQGWTTVWKKALVNDVAPVEALVSSTGQTATLDNWGMRGRGDDTVVIYDVTGLPVCSLGLYDLFPAVVVDNFPRSVSSIQWRTTSRFSDDGHVLMLMIASPTVLRVRHDRIEQEEAAFELGLRMNDCSVVPPSSDVWHEVLATAKRRQSDLDEEHTVRHAKFLAPLSAPDDENTQAWKDYLVSAWFRVKTTSESNGYPRVQVLTPSERTGYDASFNKLQDELQLLTGWSDILVVGSASPKDLVAAMHQFAARTPSGALRAKQVFIALADADFAAVSDALLPTEAEIVQIDPTIPIPQSEHNLRRFAENEQARAEEVAARERRAKGRPHWWEGY